MAEIKHDFTSGKMNKDLDERLVRNGEYRHALNIQVRTTSGGDGGDGNAGVAQNLQGNSQIGSSMGDSLITGFLDADFVCVGSIADEKTDNAYFLFTNAHSTAPIKIDTIIQQNIITGTATPVVVDKWKVAATTSEAGGIISINGTFNTITLNGTGNIETDLRENMSVMIAGIDPSTGVSYNDLITNVKIKSIVGDVITLYDYHTANLTLASSVVFEHERVLKFDEDVRITGINIIDDLLLFTDGVNEPKKINITRSIAGTNTYGNTHTNLMVMGPNGDLVEAGELEFVDINDISILNSDLLEEHVTVLRPAPKTPPTLEINTRDVGELQFTTPDQLWLLSGSVPDVGDMIYLGVDTLGASQTSPDLIETSFVAGDMLTVNQENVIEGETALYFKIEFITYVTTDGVNTAVLTPTSKIQVLIINDLPEMGDADNEWLIKIELDRPKFELKFPRFGYRYKYEDGEYSAFSPWSELGFDPGMFNYDSTQGYNLGMVNTIQSLVVKDFIPYYTDRALDIVGVDILYKSTDSANVYTIKSIKKERDPEWELFSPGLFASDGVDSIETGRLEITSEAIHRVLPSNQILRSFDNVPRYAKAQEITGSRVVYGNYTQGYDLDFPVGLNQTIKSEEVGVQPKKSVKTIRDYKIGMVFGDKYGRETPVIASTNAFAISNGTYTATTGDIPVERSLCALANTFTVKQEWANPLGSGDPSSMPWMDYVKYYVKETSNEYYNLVLDRWYYARDNENIWLSFPSADRNKIDNETYLLLKKAHGEDIAVLEKARYKVIAIENEAPDFIKIDHRSMGLVRMTHNPGTFSSMFTDSSQNPNSNEPNKLTNPNTTSIQIDAQEWDSFLDRYGENLRGELKVRIVGRTVTMTTSPTMVAERNSGRFVSVTHHFVNTAGFAVINFKESFGDSANMRQVFLNAGLDINEPYSSTSANDLEYYLEFKEEVVENKPEFDGRFFALIEKDIAIEKNVEKFSGAGVGFIEIESYKIGYIDSQKTNPALNGKYSTSATTPATLYNNYPAGTVNGNTNYLTDSGLASEWWGFGFLTDPIEANFFSMGCHWPNNQYDGSGQVASVNYSQQTKSFWAVHRAFHKSAGNGYDYTFNDGYANPNRIFLDGARAHTFQLYEYDSTGYDAGDWRVNDGNSTGGNYYGGISIYNYKPTALDEGDASEGFGRMVISQQSHIWENGNMGPDTEPENEIWYHLALEGTLFQFKNDDSNDGAPHVYKTINRDVVDPSILYPLEKTSEVFNYGETNQPNCITMGEDGVCTEWATTPPTTSAIYTSNPGNIFGDSCDNEATAWPDYGTFGGENVGMWGNGGLDENGNVSYDVSSITPVTVTDGLFSVNVGTFYGASGSGCGDYNFWPNVRLCGRCLKSSGPGESQQEDNRCNRSSMRFQFRRMDPDTGELTNIGLNPEEWDPRGEAKHDGTAGNISIQIMQKVDESSSIIIPESDRSVWETEPKESVGLDIYYEATHAIPIQLKKGNTLAFAPLKSKVNAIRRVTGGWAGVDLQSYSFNSDDFTDTMVGGVEYTSNESLIKVVNTDSSGVVVNNTHGLGIGDFITFTHSSGLRTRSQIEGHYALVNGTYQEQTPTTVTITYDPAVLTDSTTDNNTVTLSDPVGFSTGVNIVFDAINSNTGISQGDASNVSGVFGKNFSTLTEDIIQLTDTSFFDQTQPTSLTATFVMPTGFYQIIKNVYQYEVDLGWHNCYSFGNGVESDRIRDDFNAPQIDNGIKVSTTFIDYGQEDKTSGLTYSGLYNATSSVNDLNEFNMGEKISKNINPAYGSIQALKTRDTDLVTFCEDKILKILANKEAVYMADNNPNIVATDRVLGQVTTFKGDYGISKNPESLATDQYRMYFTDTQRGAVLRLSMDGLTPISDVGMRTWFRENLRGGGDFLGNFDIVNGEYNLTLNKTTTVSFNEKSKGWVSFKSFIPQEGLSVSGTYLTVKNGGIFKHYVDEMGGDGVVNNRNTFYNAVDPDESNITVMFNDMPGTVKSFKTINYEGSQAKIDKFSTVTQDGVNYTDGEYYNIFSNKKGWWVDNFETDLQSGKVYWFVDKENKWFNNICGTDHALDNLDTSEFTVQGIGTQKSAPTTDYVAPTYTLLINNNSQND